MSQPVVKWWRVQEKTSWSSLEKTLIATLEKWERKSAAGSAKNHLENPEFVNAWLEREVGYQKSRESAPKAEEVTPSPLSQE